MYSEEFLKLLNFSFLRNPYIYRKYDFKATFYNNTNLIFYISAGLCK